MTALAILETIRASARHQVATTAEGKLLAAAGFGAELDHLVSLIARNAAMAIECEMFFADDDDDAFLYEAPTQPVDIGAEAAPGIIVVERSAS